MENFIELYKRTQSSWDKFKVFEADIQRLIDGSELIFFFKKGKEVFGSTEEGRMAFAVMNDKSEDKRLRDDVRVHAINLSKSMGSDKIESSLSREQMSEVKVIDRERAEKILQREGKKST